MSGRVGFKILVARRIFQLRRAIRVDTQRLRLKSMNLLEEIFNVATRYARGEIEWEIVGGRKYPVTLKQKQLWARIAAYVAQIMSNVADSFDERQIDRDLDRLEKLVDEARSKSKARELGAEAQRDAGSRGGV
jgi:hypothetical protein